MWAAAIKQAKRVTLQRVHAHSPHVRLQYFHHARCICAAQNVSVASLKSHAEKAKAGIEPIDTDGEIDLIDESDEKPSVVESRAIPRSGNKKRAAAVVEEQNVEVTDEDELFTARIHSKPQSTASAVAAAAAATRLLKSKPARSTNPHRDDLIHPPTLPASTTHSSWNGATGKSSFEAISVKQSTWKAATFRNNASAAANSSATQSSSNWGTEQQWAPEQQDEAAKFEALSRSSKFGWAQAKRAAKDAQQSEGNDAQQNDIKNSQPQGEVPAWTDADYLLLFPHLKYIRDTAAAAEPSSSTETPSTSIIPQGMRVASEQETQANLAEMRRRFPELERLHVASTWIKIRKWREMLGATKLQPHQSENNSEANNTTSESNPDGTATTTPAASPSTTSSLFSTLPSNFPSNALHLRYYQSDVYMSNEEISLMLSKEMELLYSSIEGLIAPRLNILRTHLPGVNLRSLLLRNPSLLLMDLQGNLPTKLQELKQIFPEINLTTLVEKEPKILHHAVSSYIIPRLNLFQGATSIPPEQVIEFFGVEFPQALLVRWNRLKRVEIVKMDQFWTWWNEGGAVEAGRTDVVPIPSNEANKLPFTFFNDLIFMTSEKFEQTFPFYQIQISPVEQELLQLRNQRHKSRTDRDAPSRERAASSLGSLPVSVLSTVPGNPQSISLALGANDKSHLTRDELKAQQRMDYLQMKQTKAEKRAMERDVMREREAAFNRDKMSAYTQKFQAHRRKVLEPYQHAQEEASRPQQQPQQELQFRPAPSAPQHQESSSFSSRRSDRNQKNRAGPATSSRHFAHAPGMIEQSGVEPLHSSFEQPPPPRSRPTSYAASSSFSSRPPRSYSEPPPSTRNSYNKRESFSSPRPSAASATAAASSSSSEYKFGQSLLASMKETPAPVYDSPFPPTPRAPEYEKPAFENKRSFDKPSFDRSSSSFKRSSFKDDNNRDFNSNRRFNSNREGGRREDRDGFSKPRPFESRGGSKFGGGRDGDRRSGSADAPRRSFRDSRGGSGGSSYSARQRDSSKSYAEYTLSKPSTGKKSSGPRSRK